GNRRCASLSAHPCQPVLLAFAQDECREFRDLFKRGKLSCTRENDPGGRIFCSESSQPICGTDGKTYKNECGEISCVLGALLLSKHRSKCLRLI
uniref:Kazal-like domain-containing protein n=1 Tax=Cyanoderma ruficeps TaxID=181631 RepID=A0A8C3NY44_9PASS